MARIRFINQVKEALSCVRQKLNCVFWKFFLDRLRLFVLSEKSHENQDWQRPYVIINSFQFLQDWHLQIILNLLNPVWVRQIKLSFVPKFVQINFRKKLKNIDLFFLGFFCQRNLGENSYPFIHIKLLITFIALYLLVWRYME